MNLVQLLDTLPEQLREQILIRAGAEATAALSITCKQALSLIQRDDYLWHLFAERSFGHTRDIEKVDAKPLFLARTHQTHRCKCIYFRYWAARKHTCAYCGTFERDNSGGSSEGRGVVCAKCCKRIASWNRLYDF